MEIDFNGERIIQYRIQIMNALNSLKTSSSKFDLQRYNMSRHNLSWTEFLCIDFGILEAATRAVL